MAYYESSTIHDDLALRISSYADLSELADTTSKRDHTEYAVGSWLIAGLSLGTITLLANWLLMNWSSLCS